MALEKITNPSSAVESFFMEDSNRHVIFSPNFNA
jgi:hypothetical protein